MAVIQGISLVEAFRSVPDPRGRHGRRHPLPAVLGMLAVGTMCGGRSIYAILQWGRDHGQEMAHRLGLAKHGIPTDGMMSNLLRRMDIPAYEAALSRWIDEFRVLLDCGEPEALSVDGKTLRGSQGHEVPGVHLLSAFAVGLGLVLKEVPAGANKQEGGEITAASELLTGLVLEGKVITGDALFAQRGLCGQIVKARGDYLLAVKENQPKLLAEIEDVFRSPRAPFLPMKPSTSMVRVWRNARSTPAANWPDTSNGPDSRPRAGCNGKSGIARPIRTPRRRPI